MPFAAGYELSYSSQPPPFLTAPTLLFTRSPTLFLKVICMCARTCLCVCVCVCAHVRVLLS